MLNTPPTYSIYIAGLVFQWLKLAGRRGGDGAEEHREGRLLYDTIDGSGGYYAIRSPGPTARG